MRAKSRFLADPRNADPRETKRYQALAAGHSLERLHQMCAVLEGALRNPPCEGSEYEINGFVAGAERAFIDCFGHGRFIGDYPLLANKLGAHQPAKLQPSIFRRRNA